MRTKTAEGSSKRIGTLIWRRNYLAKKWVFGGVAGEISIKIGSSRISLNFDIRNGKITLNNQV